MAKQNFQTFAEWWNSHSESYQKQTADDALFSVNGSALCYNVWLGICAAYKSAGGDFETCRKWCMEHEKCKPNELTSAWWDGLPGKPGEFGALVAAAKAQGWRFPKDEESLFSSLITRDKCAAGLNPDAGEGNPSDAAQEALSTTQAQRDIDESQQRRGEAFEYMERRGISEDTCFQFGIGTLYRFGKRYCLIPYPGTTFYNARCMDIKSDARAAAGLTGGKYLKPKGLHQRLFNADALTTAGERDVVFFTEGEIDAISIIQQGHKACSGTDSDLDIVIRENGTKAAAVVVVEDNDGNRAVNSRGVETATAGEHKATKACKTLEKHGIFFLRLKPEEGKDANAFLLANPGRFAEWLDEVAAAAREGFSEKQSEQLNKYDAALNAADALTTFGDWFNKRGAALPTGFRNLDSALGGGLYPELHIIGAVSSIGKTALVMQIADNVAAAGSDVLIFALEMGKYELMARSISRYTTNAPTRAAWLTQREVERDTNAASIDAAKREYLTAAKNLYIVESMQYSVADIRAAVQKHVQVTGNKPLVIVDYMQLLAANPGHERDTEKQQMDTACQSLKRIVNEYAVPVIAISSLNRMAYNNPVDMQSFKESGGIEYTAGVLMGMQFSAVRNQGSFDANAERKKPTRDIDVVILKHRAGAISEPVEFAFMAAYSRFDEKPPKHKYQAPPPRSK